MPIEMIVFFLVLGIFVDSIAMFFFFKIRRSRKINELSLLGAILGRIFTFLIFIIGTIPLWLGVVLTIVAVEKAFMTYDNYLHDTDISIFSVAISGAIVVGIALLLQKKH